MPNGPDLTKDIVAAIEQGFNKIAAAAATGAAGGAAGGGGIPGIVGGGLGGFAGIAAEVAGEAADYIGATKDIKFATEGATEAFLGFGKSMVTLNLELAALKQQGLLNSLPGMMGAVAEPTRRVAEESLEAARSFNRATGQGGEFNEQIYQLRENLKGFPVSSGDVNNSMQELSKGFTDFTLGGIQPAELQIAKTITILGKLGASVNEQVKVVQGLRKGFSMSDEQINTSLLEFEALADTLNMNVGDVMSNFQRQIPLFASFGDNGVNTFKRLQMQSKATGIEMERLVSLSEKFTTIDESAKVIGQLNQLLGDTGLLPSDLMVAALEDPAKAMDMLQGSLSGFDVENMNAGMKRALADIMGFGTDVDKFLSFARGGVDALDELEQKSAKTEAEMFDRVRAGTEIQDMQKAVSDLAFGVDGVASQLNTIEQDAFKESYVRALQFRGAVGEISDEIMSILNFETTMSDVYKQFTDAFNAAVPGKSYEDVVTEQRAAMNEQVASALRDVNVHVYLDKKQLAKELKEPMAQALME